ncbi:MAG: carbamoyl-phosphate synthase domain-containing protein, partial [Gammaproteobacteria bacterium]
MKLLLEDGTTLLGRAFGAERPVCGEVVFNTGMSGYVETLTDPSYRGQILTLTYPLIGNYGVPPARGPGELTRPFESSGIQVQGLIVQHYAQKYSHHGAKRSLAQWLTDEHVPAVTGIDTRTLTRKLREVGTMRGWLVPANMDLEQARERAEAVDMEKEVFELVAPPAPVTYPGGDLSVLLVAVGAKENIVCSLL